MLFGLAAVLATSASGCIPVPGADQLWQSETRWIIVGELHGTTETPEAFANLACLAAETGRPVMVALEYSADWQPVIDAYLASDGGPKARLALLRLSMWNADMQDGRGSVAVLGMLDRFRRMKQAGQITGVIGTDVGRSTPSGQTRDAAMAQAWTAIPVAANGMVLALAGNFHAMRNAVVQSGQTISTAGSLMPPKRTMTVNVVGNGGTAWNCQSDGCGAHNAGPTKTATAGIVFNDRTDASWTATYELGRPTTAAIPAIAPKRDLPHPTSARFGG